MTVDPGVIAGLVALGAAAGALGALVGIGGGVVLVPALVLLFGFDFRVAVAVSLVAVIATSTAAGSVYVATGQTNMRLGMALEVATTVGGIAGGLLASVVPTLWLALLLAGMLAMTAVLLLREHDEHGAVDDEKDEDGRTAGGYEVQGRLAGGFLDERSGELVEYEAERLWLGGALSAVAGTVSGLLGIGGGFLKVPAMHLGMRVPVKVAAATSNFMIGVTALSSFAVYLARGDVHPYPAALVAVGVTGGSLIGTRLQGRSSPAVLQRVLAAVLALVAVQLMVRAVGGGLGGG